MNKYLLDLHRVDELKNLQPTIFSVGVLKSYTGIRTIVSHVLGSSASERGTVTTEQVQLGILLAMQCVSNELKNRVKYIISNAMCYTMLYMIV